MKVYILQVFVIEYGTLCKNLVATRAFDSQTKLDTAKAIWSSQYDEVETEVLDIE